MPSTNFDMECFIGEVHSRPLLWKESMKNYKNTDVTNVLWDEVAGKFGTTRIIAKSKWKNLKDTYRKKKQTIPTPRSGSAGGPIMKITWKYFDLLGFLDDNDVTQGVNESNLTNDNEYNNTDTVESVDGTNDEEANDFYLDEYDMEYDEEDAASLHTSPTPSGSNNANKIGTPTNTLSSIRRIKMAEKKRKNASNEFKKDVIAVEKKKCELIERLGNQKLTPDENFCLSLATYFEGLQKCEKLTLQSNIQAVISADLKKFKKEKKIKNKKKMEKLKSTFSGVDIENIDDIIISSSESE